MSSPANRLRQQLSERKRRQRQIREQVRALKRRMDENKQAFYEERKALPNHTVKSWSELGNTWSAEHHVYGDLKDLE